jgi:hypothetical protein
MDNKITNEKIMKYLSITKRALNKARTKFDKERIGQASDFFDMASRYHADAEYFMDKGEIVNAFAAVNYAHGWLDAGARIGLFKVKDNKLFTVD